jgi:hypothetical protein
MEDLQWALDRRTPNPTDDMLEYLGQGIGNIAAHEIGHQLVRAFSSSGKVVNGMNMHDGSLNTYNGGDCNDSSNYTGISQDGLTPIHWSTDAGTSLTNILGRKR